MAGSARAEFRFLTGADQKILAATEAGVKKAVVFVLSKAKQLAPWEYGVLSNSIAAERVRVGVWKVGTNVEYAVYQEFGTVNMAAQPYLGPALLAAEQKFGKG